MSKKSDTYSEHRVFPMTYLQRVIFKVDFEDIDDSCYPQTKTFFKNIFELELSKERFYDLKKNALCFGNSSRSIQWKISAKGITILVEHESYTSFKTSLLPLIKICNDFLTLLGRQFGEIYLDKINLIPVEYTAADDMTNYADVFFNENILADWKFEPYLSEKTSKIFRSCKEINESYNIEIISGFITEENCEDSLQPSRYILDISSKINSENTLSSSIEELSQNMNDWIFNIFINSVTRQVIDSMEGKES